MATCSATPNQRRRNGSTISTHVTHDRLWDLFGPHSALKADIGQAGRMRVPDPIYVWRRLAAAAPNAAPTRRAQTTAK